LESNEEEEEGHRHLVLITFVLTPTIEKKKKKPEVPLPRQLQHTSQSRPDSGLGLSHFQFKRLDTLSICSRLARQQLSLKAQPLNPNP